jgi:hypothetical protein
MWGYLPRRAKIIRVPVMSDRVANAAARRLESAPVGGSRHLSLGVGGCRRVVNSSCRAAVGRRARARYGAPRPVRPVRRRPRRPPRSTGQPGHGRPIMSLLSVTGSVVHSVIIMCLLSTRQCGRYGRFVAYRYLWWHRACIKTYFCRTPFYWQKHTVFCNIPRESVAL